MARVRARVRVAGKRSQHDPEAETVRRSLVELGFPAAAVSTSKTYELTFEASSRREARALVEQMCAKLLVNPVKDDYEVEVDGEART
jgi:phosphoribosylformylglycinamidine synthase PurS subunit